MNSRNWVRLFLSTLLLGAVVTSIVGFIVKWNEYQPYFITGDFVEILFSLFWFVGVGFIFSLISQMGFFAYLTVHRFGLGIFKRNLWNWIQVMLILFVLFDLVYFRYAIFAETGEGFISYLVLAVAILIVGLIIAYIKSIQTNIGAFIPAVFFMVVVTTVEWVPALRVNEEGWLYFMLIPLLVCNAYQLLVLHKINQKSA
ncbi:KinB-signaling pathway activation protein [Bacillus carboniphilus]|uniref:KinB-signaling pathway activation protein n=1 Tax=Bacillus carboniphilus TaxID=86663 RepID=A0ABY9JTE8_9BACI|nr:KinB-signaling pathway activation protein [Bacillus carboniphilus]WLR42023.1 KinB-signaling pathway activation protein [Bacillus carboniphilus]